MSLLGGGKSNEFIFQSDMLRQLIANGWLLGKPENYNRELALYEEDLLGFVKETQDAQWRKFSTLYPNNPEQKFLERVANQLNKADLNVRPIMDNLNIEMLGRVSIPVPPVKEQHKILTYVHRIAGKYEGVVEKAEYQVGLLRERRTTLISSAVTGKIDVRDWVSSDMEVA
ncbi:MAG: hypothetical protein JAY67_12125 [Candidatus Thiodiazotropha taylori]|nr:hypothetical protein [Candidatus Thiodiazotropha taylori]